MSHKLEEVIENSKSKQKTNSKLSVLLNVYNKKSIILSICR